MYVCMCMYVCINACAYITPTVCNVCMYRLTPTVDVCIAKYKASTKSQSSVTMKYTVHMTMHNTMAIIARNMSSQFLKLSDIFILR